MTNSLPTPDPRKFPFPPAVPIAALLLAWALQKLHPLDIPWPAWTPYPAWLLATTPFLLAFWAAYTFRRHHTAVNPRGQSTLIVSSGPYRFTRNPMYLSLMFVYLGLALLLHLAYALPLIVPVFLTFHFAIIRREEIYLTQKFGSAYVEYTHQTRRWL